MQGVFAVLKIRTVRSVSKVGKPIVYDHELCMSNLHPWLFELRDALLCEDQLHSIFFVQAAVVVIIGGLASPAKYCSMQPASSTC